MCFMHDNIYLCEGCILFFQGLVEIVTKHFSVKISRKYDNNVNSVETI